jgi:peroxiredoxin
MKALALLSSLFLMSAARAEDSPALRDFEKLQKEYEDVWREYAKKGRKAHSIEEVTAHAAKNPERSFTPRFLDLAEKYAADPASVLPALHVIHTTTPGQEAKLHERALAVLLKHPGSRHLISIVPTLNPLGEGDAKLLRAILAQHPDLKTQARAARVLIRYLSDCDEKGTEANLDEEYREKLEKQTSKAYVKNLIDRLHHNRRELQELNRQMQEKFTKLLPDLSPGRMIPDATVTDVEGKKHRLSELRGKLVLIHVFSVERNRPEWLYYMHQFYWADEFKGRPIVRVNICIDQKKETFTTWLRHHPIPDINVWAGTESDYYCDWLGEVRYQEQTFLVNADGIIKMRCAGTNELHGPLDNMIIDLFTQMKVPPRKLPQAPVVKDDKLSEAARAYEQFRLDFQYAGKRYQRAWMLARTDEEKRQASNDISWQKFGTRALDLAEKHIKDPVSFDLLAFRIRHEANTDRAEYEQALNLLGKHYADSPRMIELLRPSAPGLVGGIVLVKRVLEKNPDKPIQSRSCRMLKEFYELQAGAAEHYLKANPELQKAIRRRSGEEYIKELVEALEKNKELRTKYVQLYKEKYANVVPVIAKDKPMLDTELTGLDGKKFKLSDLRGKIVYLNIFSVDEHRPTFSHQRIFSDQVKGKPFVIVNVSVDERKDLFEDYLRRDPTPWVNTWVGPHSKVYADWMMQGHQTTYLIDTKGTLRAWGIGWGDLPDKAEELLAEMGK